MSVVNSTKSKKEMERKDYLFKLKSCMKQLVLLVVRKMNQFEQTQQAIQLTKELVRCLAFGVEDPEERKTISRMKSIKSISFSSNRRTNNSSGGSIVPSKLRLDSSQILWKFMCDIAKRKKCRVVKEIIDNCKEICEVDVQDDVPAIELCFRYALSKGKLAEFLRDANQVDERTKSSYYQSYAILRHDESTMVMLGVLDAITNLPLHFVMPEATPLYTVLGSMSSNRDDDNSIKTNLNIAHNMRDKSRKGKKKRRSKKARLVDLGDNVTPIDKKTKKRGKRSKTKKNKRKFTTTNSNLTVGEQDTSPSFSQKFERKTLIIDKKPESKTKTKTEAKPSRITKVNSGSKFPVAIVETHLKRPEPAYEKGEEESKQKEGDVMSTDRKNSSVDIEKDVGKDSKLNFIGEGDDEKTLTESDLTGGKGSLESEDPVEELNELQEEIDEMSLLRDALEMHRQLLETKLKLHSLQEDRKKEEESSPSSKMTPELVKDLNPSDISSTGNLNSNAESSLGRDSPRNSFSTADTFQRAAMNLDNYGSEGKLQESASEGMNIMNDGLENDGEPKLQRQVVEEENKGEEENEPKIKKQTIEEKREESVDQTENYEEDMNENSRQKSFESRNDPEDHNLPQSVKDVVVIEDKMDEKEAVKLGKEDQNLTSEELEIQIKTRVSKFVEDCSKESMEGSPQESKRIGTVDEKVDKALVEEENFEKRRSSISVTLPRMSHELGFHSMYAMQDDLSSPTASVGSFESFPYRGQSGTSVTSRKTSTTTPKMAFFDPTKAVVPTSSADRKFGSRTKGDSKQTRIPNSSSTIFSSLISPEAPSIRAPQPPAAPYTLILNSKQSVLEIKTDHFPKPRETKVYTRRPQVITAQPREHDRRSQAKSSVPGKIDLIELLTDSPEHIGKSPTAMFREQKGRCKGCGAVLPNGMFTSWFRCRYTGALYCDNCHSRQKRPMPWRLIKDYNPRPSYVCTFAQQFLDSIAGVPMLSMDQLKPGFPGSTGPFIRIHFLRKKLSLAKGLLMKCERGSRLLEHFMNGDRNRGVTKSHLFQGGDLLKMYSLRDLVHAMDGRLKKWLEKAMNAIKAHVDNCEYCQGRGAVCGICNREQLEHLIFPYDIERTTRCLGCLGHFHRKCLHEKQCPRCTAVEGE